MRYITKLENETIKELEKIVKEEELPLEGINTIKVDIEPKQYY
jgi:hypothetical protein